jgi:xanthine dehydrogenase YagR molybdenum-binding subunit
MDGSIGLPVVRRDATSKATGAARYAADYGHVGTAYAALTLSTVARGRITRVDTEAAEAVPGVQLVLTHRSMNRDLGDETFVMGGGHMQSSFMPLTSDEVHYAGQIVGLVVADTTEAAEQAARALNLEYAAQHASASIDDPDRVTKSDGDPEITIGDADAAMARAPVQVDHVYETPAQHHHPMELYATTASWDDGKLTVETPSQWVMGQRAALATIFGIPAEDVHVISPYIGGAFGSKATLLPHTVLVAAVAQRLGRPVKLVVPRDAMFTVGSFRPATRNRIAFGAERDGTMTAMIHEAIGQDSEIDHIAFPGTNVTARMYDIANIRTSESSIATNVNTPGFQRAPAEAPAFFAFESAVDELAIALGMDPVELRIKNEPKVDPVKKLPWSSRSLVQCYRRGAELFGWDKRTPEVGSMKTEDGVLIGYGCATATYPSAMAPSAAQVALTADGLLRVRTSAHDVGTGAYTVLGQVAADVLGVDNEMVRVELGDSNLPSGPMSGGSITTGSAGSAVSMAARALREKVLQAAVAEKGPFAGRNPATLQFAGGHLVGADGTAHSLAEVVKATPSGSIEAAAEWKPGQMDDASMQKSLLGGMAMDGPVTKTHAIYSFGAQFAEVRVDPLLRTIRVARMVGAFACGRVINPRTARSNLAGGMVWGASFALLEETQVDRPRARFANQDLAGYHISTTADIGEVTAEIVDETDTVVNAIGAKAVGEIGIVGMPAAIANAVYHATGIRVRKTPILIEDLLPVS